MDIASLLGRYLNPQSNQPPAPEEAERDFDRICSEVPREELGDGVAEAFRSDRTPPFPQMLAQMFGRADPQERAGILNQLLSALGPMAVPAGAGGLLGKLLDGKLAGAGGPGQSGQFPPQVTVEQAQQVSPQDVEQIADQAAREQPTVMDRLGHLAAQNPALVKKLGGAALMLVIANVASRRRN
jgi:hypothetical protein